MDAPQYGSSDSLHTQHRSLTPVNQLIVWAPRWSKRDFLVADHKLGNDNEIIITAKDRNGKPYFPNSLRITGAEARQFPLEQMKTKQGGTIAVRAIPLTTLTKE
jgi:hypothetical protein